jgi:hypothetical protein
MLICYPQSASDDRASEAKECNGLLVRRSWDLMSHFGTNFGVLEIIFSARSPF